MDFFCKGFSLWLIACCISKVFKGFKMNFNCYDCDIWQSFIIYSFLEQITMRGMHSKDSVFVMSFWMASKNIIWILSATWNPQKPPRSISVMTTWQGLISNLEPIAKFNRLLYIWMIYSPLVFMLQVYFLLSGPMTLLTCISSSLKAY